MPLRLQKRSDSAKWYLRGKIDEIPEGKDYYQSTGKTEEADARAYIEFFKNREILKFHGVAEAEEKFTFADATDLYKPTPEFAKYLYRILPHLGDVPVSGISGKMVRDLGPRLTPDNSTATWSKQFIKPIRAVINNAHDLGKCSPIKIKGYSDQETEDQDTLRGKQSGVEKVPGDWLWIFLFKEEAPQRIGLLAQFMFETAARIGQAVALKPDDLKLDQNIIMMPASKGYRKTEVKISDELCAELKSLKPQRPRKSGKPNQKRPLLAFGFASRSSIYRTWKDVCDSACIDRRMPHAAGRHGFATEMLNRMGIDPHTVAKLGRWKDVKLLFDTYGHSEDGERKVMDALRTGRVQALRDLRDNALNLNKES
ncbi:tyrosine-type recombinase/integrase [Pseudovibrio sp. WM33]|uniref:tyrosine-type recombinase/integrase n=1 Tax=Pseudovibrio sp. WM33 TaxID=1735585 RepID=UPI0007AE9226|nr:tyrosine-type recombinase/integrase [Pseudovibrio sp. WM33]KZL24698.1 Tyrosine recombinase XerD [Pseudovibrio sp. WM33]